MTGPDVTTYAPFLYLSTVVAAAWVLHRPVAQAMDLNDDSDTHDFVIAGMFVVVAGVLWPIVLLAWLLRPRRDAL
jgi:hypothetical protein